MAHRRRKRWGTDDEYFDDFIADGSFKSFNDKVQQMMKKLSKDLPESVRKPIASADRGDGSSASVHEHSDVEKNATSAKEKSLDTFDLDKELKKLKDELNYFGGDGQSNNRPFYLSGILGQHESDIEKIPDISRRLYEYPNPYPFRDPYYQHTTAVPPTLKPWPPYYHRTQPTDSPRSYYEPPHVVHQKPGLHAWHIILVAVVAIISLFAYACTVSSLRRQTRNRRSQPTLDASAAAPLAARAHPAPTAPPRSEIYSETSSSAPGPGRSRATPPLLPPRMQSGTALPEIGFILLADPPSSLRRAPTPPPPYPGLPAKSSTQAGGIRDVEGPPPSYQDVAIINEAAAYKDPP